MKKIKYLFVLFLGVYTSSLFSQKSSFAIGGAWAFDDGTFKKEVIREMPALHVEYRRFLGKQRWGFSARFSHFSAHYKGGLYNAALTGGTIVDEQLVLVEYIDNPVATDDDYLPFEDTGLIRLDGSNYRKYTYILGLGVEYRILNFDKHKLSFRISGNVTYNSTSFFFTDVTGNFTPNEIETSFPVLLSGPIQNRSLGWGNGVHLTYEYHPNEHLFFGLSHGGHNSYLFVAEQEGFYTIIGGLIGIKL